VNEQIELTEPRVADAAAARLLFDAAHLAPRSALPASWALELVLGGLELSRNSALRGRARASRGLGRSGSPFKCHWLAIEMSRIGHSHVTVVWKS
jgi:hypothetical protein